MKVFISHASDDKVLVRRIAGELESAGIGVWLDEADIRVGESIPEGVAKGLEESDVLLLAFSRSAIASAWVRRELNAFFSQAMRNGQPILPARLDEADPPTLLSDVKYADFRLNFETGMTALLGAVGIAEEIATSRFAASTAAKVGASLTSEERRLCAVTWSNNGSFKVSIFLKLSSGFPVGKARLLGILEGEGLIEEYGVGDLEWRATPLGMRVFALWGSE